MDETAKTEARNYLSAAGFFLIAAYYLLDMFAHINGGHVYSEIEMVTGLGLLLISVLLIILRKRDMIAMLFMMLSFFYLTIGQVSVFAGGGVITACFSALVFLTLLITLTGKDKAKWMLILLPLAMVVIAFLALLTGEVPFVLFGIVFVLGIYFALACASEKISLPGRNLLTADEKTDFKASGSALGYLLFASFMGAWSIFDIAGESLGITSDVFQFFSIVFAVLMTLVSVLLIAVAKMRFTPVLFLLTAITAFLAMHSSGAMVVGIAVLFLVIGIFAILRKESRILPGIMLILTAVVYFILSGFGIEASVLAVGIIDIVVTVLSIYLAFAVYSPKLPKF